MAYKKNFYLLVSVMILKRERDIKVHSEASGEVWEKGVTWQAHAEASLPPEGPATQWYSIE